MSRHYSYAHRKPAIAALRAAKPVIKQCLRCRGPFRSLDPRKNRLCEPCCDINAAADENGLYFEAAGCISVLAI